MRTHTSPRILLWTSLAATLLLWPTDALAQRGRGGHGSGGRVSRPVVVNGRGYRPVYYRSYYRPYFASSFFWGAYGWYPYYGYGFYPYGYYPYGGFGYPYGGGYYGSWYDNLGSLRIEAKPREAQVYVDGYFAGLVDDFDGFSQRLRAKPGEHQIELYLDGYQPLKEKMLFRPGSSMKIKAELKPLASGEAMPPKPEPITPPPGPPDASTSADPRDQPRDQPGEPYRTRRPYRNAPPPNVNVEPAPAAPPDDQAPGQAPARSAYGTLSIRVQPSDAVVLIDGERWEGGDTRERLVIEVSEGTHRIEIQKQGYTSYSTEVRIRRGQVSTVNVSLLTAHEI